MASKFRAETSNSVVRTTGLLNWWLVRKKCVCGRQWMKNCDKSMAWMDFLSFSEGTEKKDHKNQSPIISSKAAEAGEIIGVLLSFHPAEEALVDFDEKSDTDDTADKGKQKGLSVVGNMPFFTGFIPEITSWFFGQLLLLCSGILAWNSNFSMAIHDECWRLDPCTCNKDILMWCCWQVLLFQCDVNLENENQMKQCETSPGKLKINICL